MNAVRKKKLMIIISAALIIATVSALVLYALRQNISLFYTPTQIANQNVQPGLQSRLGGMVVKGSIHRGEDLQIEFALTDYKHTVQVSYQGILPDLFREEQGIVAYGKVIDKQHFNASQILAKHDANYMPAELRQSLAKVKKGTINGR